MTAPIFVKTHHCYESYFDFWKLVELSGYASCFPEEVNIEQGIYIVPVLSGEIGDRYAGANARIIHWNLEWDKYPPAAGFSETWHMDAYFAELWGHKYVPIGSHPDFADAPVNGSGKIYDAAYLAYMIPRRQRIQYECGREGVMLSPSSAWGEERHRILASSKSYLHVHQLEEAPGIPGLRMVVAAAYKLPVIMERVNARGIFGEGDFLDCGYDQLAAFVKQWTWQAPPEQLQAFGDRLYERLCSEFTFRKVIENAL